MDSSHPRRQRLKATTVVTAVFLSTYILTASAENWQVLTPSAPALDTRIFLSPNGSGERSNTNYPIPQPEALLDEAVNGLPPGFLNRAFRRQRHTGKLGRVVDALGLGTIYHNPLIRTVLGRFHGSRFCLTEGCGINVKLSLRKPGLRLEHRF